jgi:hypothetical protein
VFGGIEGLYEEVPDDQRCWDLGERVSVRLQMILLNERKENEIGDAGRGIYAFALVRKESILDMSLQAIPSPKGRT